MKHLNKSMLILAAVLLAACSDDDTDAWGTFEAVEITVSSEISGRLLSLDAAEGSRVIAGEPLGLVDTVNLVLQEAEFGSRAAAAEARRVEVNANIAALGQQLELARQELGRFQRLRAQSAATSQQVERAEQEVAVLADQINGARAAAQSVGAEAAAIRATLSQVVDRKRRAIISSPVSGTVLVRLAEPGEYVQTGMPLLTVAALDTLTLRAYVSGADLPHIAIGKQVQVRFDTASDSMATAIGRVTWISSVAEFTPTPIQTRDERTTQVYAVKVAVANPHGALRIGMPGELLFRDAGSP